MTVTSLWEEHWLLTSCQFYGDGCSVTKLACESWSGSGHRREALLFSLPYSLG